MATGTTVFSRVTVVAPKTRIDVALPADVAVADILPMLLEMAKEVTPDGGARHGGWCLTKMGEGPLTPNRTLASLGVVDGEILQLRRRVDNPPPPLYDDVVDAISDSDPNSFRPWTKETAHRLGHLAGVLALLGAAVAVFLAGPANNLAAAITGGVAAIAAISLGTVIARVYRAVTTGLLIAAAGGLPMAFVSGFYIVPGAQPRPAFLLAFTLILVASAACIMLLGTGITVFVASATAGLFGTIAFFIATFVDHPAPGIAAGAAAVGVATISLLPRITIQLAKLPLPQVPGNAEDLKEDGGFPDYAVIERRSGLAHEYMTGMIIGCGATAAVGSVIAASSETIWGPIFGVVVAIVLLMRSRTYANGVQAIALLMCGIATFAGLMIGWLMLSAGDTLTLLLWTMSSLLALAVSAFVFGVVFPEQKFSPVLRRSVDIFEAVMIAAVIPLALAVMDLYSTFRHLIQIDLGF